MNKEVLIKILQDINMDNDKIKSVEITYATEKGYGYQEDKTETLSIKE